MIQEREALAITHLLNAAGYLPNIEGQAEAWTRVINAAAPWATIADALKAAETACSKKFPRVTTGDVVTELNLLRERQTHNDRRRAQLTREPTKYNPVPRERLREIFAEHGLNPWTEINNGR